jgi:ribosomal protein L37AE/L43A
MSAARISSSDIAMSFSAVSRPSAKRELRSWRYSALRCDSPAERRSAMGVWKTCRGVGKSSAGWPGVYFSGSEGK